MRTAVSTRTVPGTQPTHLLTEVTRLVSRHLRALTILNHLNGGRGHVITNGQTGRVKRLYHVGNNNSTKDHTELDLSRGRVVDARGTHCRLKGRALRIRILYRGVSTLERLARPRVNGVTESDHLHTVGTRDARLVSRRTLHTSVLVTRGVSGNVLTPVTFFDRAGPLSGE